MFSFFSYIYFQLVYLLGGHGHLDIQQQKVTALTWPQNKGIFEGIFIINQYVDNTKIIRSKKL